MATKTTTIYECDRCGHSTTSGDDQRKYEAGCTTLKYHGHQGGMSVGGDWGGCNHKGEMWLCLDCTREFLAFVRAKPNRASQPQETHPHE